MALALGSGGLQAATFTVPSAADSGAGSANAAPGADEITFADNLGTITLTGGQLEITETLTITGPAAGQTIDGGKDGGRIGRIFGVTSANTALTLENLTLTNAKTTAAKVSNNCSGSAGQGGAICTLGGQLTLTNSTVSGNTSSISGGRVYGFDAVTLTSSILAGNVVGGTALDKGTADASLTTDQRGQPRQYGSAVDIGAFELQSFALTVTVTGGGTGTGTVTGSGLGCTITAGTPPGPAPRRSARGPR